MKPIRPGDRGPAVQDIQRRLRSLGHDLGPTGVDGVFLGRTQEAVRAFQAEAGVGEDSVVGPETWAALVDATFTLGDRMLYLRLPHFHGRDVKTLQSALSSLGFTCGVIDGIFGSFTERALVEFQRNAGLIADGIAGDDTIGAVTALRHVWDGKDPRAHSGARPVASRAAATLERLPFAVSGRDAAGSLVAERIANLAHATTPDARCTVLAPGHSAPEGTRLTLEIQGSGTELAYVGRPVVKAVDAATLAPRLLTALEQCRTQPPQVIVEVPNATNAGEHELQRAAVWVLDAVCLVFD